MATLASFLQSLRQARSLSLGQLALQAGVHKATLSRWEAGTHLPRIPELLRVLKALQASPAARAHGLSLLDVPRAALIQRENPPAVTMPVSLGDVLYGLRQRAGKTQSKVAQSAGVSRSLVSQWENDSGRPGTSQIQEVGFALGASAEELTVLTTRSFAQTSLELDREALHHRCCQTFYWDPGMTKASYHLHLVSLLAAVGRMLRAGKAGLGDLALVISKFGDAAQVWDGSPRLRSLYHHRALAIAENADEPLHFHVITALRTLLDPNFNPRPLRERVTTALQWQDRMATSAGQAYHLSFVAAALAEDAPEEALRLGQHYCELVADDPDESPCRLHDWGVLLRRCGRAAESVAFLSRLQPPDSFREGLYRLDMAQGFATLGSMGEASHCLEQAKQRLAGRELSSLHTVISDLERAIAP